MAGVGEDLDDVSCLEACRCSGNFQMIMDVLDLHVWIMGFIWIMAFI